MFATASSGMTGHDAAIKSMLTKAAELNQSGEWDRMKGLERARELMRYSLKRLAD